jgi:hypothetical protein
MTLGVWRLAFGVRRLARNYRAMKEDYGARILRRRTAKLETELDSGGGDMEKTNRR